jgi:hypothetical protein
MIGGYKSITVCSLTFVDPQLDHFLWLDELDWIGQQNTLENVGQVSQVELVMEVNGSFSE